MKNYSISIDTFKATDEFIGAAKFLNEKIPNAVNFRTLPLTDGSDSREEKLFKYKIRTFLLWEEKFENGRRLFSDQVYNLLNSGPGGIQNDELNQIALNKNFSMTEEEILNLHHSYPIAEMVEKGIIMELPEAYYLTPRQVSIIKSAIDLKKSAEGNTDTFKKEIETIKQILG